MRTFRVLVLLFCFCVDIQVRADTKKEEGCWGKTTPCVVQSNARKVLEDEEIRLSMSAGSLVERRSEDVVQLIDGHFYIEAKNNTKFSTPYAKIWCEDECKGLFIRTNDQIEIKGLEGRWLAQRNGEKQVYAIPTGFQIQVGEVAQDGKAQMDFPQSLPWVSTVTEWAALYPGSVDELKPTLVKFREIWKEAVEAVSDLHEKVVRREIASHEIDLAKERAKRLALEREDKSLRDLFHEKNP